MSFKFNPLTGNFDLVGGEGESLGFTPEDVANKSDDSALGNSSTLYPTQKAVKEYVDGIAISGAPDATTSSKGIVKLSGDLGGTADSPTVPGLANKYDISNPAGYITLAEVPADAVTSVNSQIGDVVLDKSDVGLSNVDNTSDTDKPISAATATALSGKQDTLVSGTNIKSVNGSSILGSGDLIISGGASDATTTTKGIIQLSGDLGGSADSPSVVGFKYSQVVYVDKANTNTYVADGSINKPYKTIEDMFNSVTDASASKRYACIIAPGTYTEAGTIRIKGWIDLTSFQSDTVIVGVSGGVTLKWSNNNSGRVFIRDIGLTSGIEVINDNPTGTSGIVLDLDNVDVPSVTFNGRGGGRDFIQLRNDVRISGNCIISSAATTVFDSTILGTLTMNDVGCVAPDAYGSAITAALRSSYIQNISISATSFDVYTDVYGGLIAGNLTIASNAPSYPCYFNYTASNAPSGVITTTGTNPAVLNPLTKAASIKYDASVSADWASPVPTNVRSALDDLAADKQNKLISSTNIKTINGSSILGSGDLVIGGGSSSLEIKDEGIQQTTSAVSIDFVGEGVSAVSDVSGNVTVTVSSVAALDATTTTKGIIKLSGDLSGTADSPTVPGLAVLEAELIDINDQFSLKVDKTGDTMSGQLTMLDSSVIIDGTITQGYPSTVEISTNNILILDTSGVDNKESSITAGEITLTRTNVASSTSDTTLTIGTGNGSAYLLANNTDYANDASSQLALNSQSLSVSYNDNISGISTNGGYGSDSFIIQTTQPDSSYVAIEGTAAGIAAIQYDGVSTTPLMPTLPEHYTVKEYVDNLETGIVDKFEVTKEPTGFPNRTDSTTSFVDASREFTIAPVGSSFDVYVKSQKFTKSSAETISIPNMSGNHYIYYNEIGTLSSTQILSSDLFQNNALVSIVYWNSDTSSHVYFAEERHGLTMDGATHTYLHTIFGARYLSGLALQNFSVNGDGNSDSHAQFTADSGSIRDEDLLITILAQSEIPVLYRQGQLWRKKSTDSFPVIYSGTGGYTGASGRLPFNEYSGGAWQLTEVANNAFVLVHVFATNDKDSPIVAIQGIATYGNVTAARNAASTEITSLSGLPFAEFAALGSVVFESTSTYTNTPKARIRSVNGGSYVDFRGTQLYTPAGEATTHGLLSGLSNDDHPQYLNEQRGDLRYNLKSNGDISETEFNLTNSQSIAQDVTSFAFSNAQVQGFTALVTVKVEAASDLFEQFTLNAIQKSGSWVMSIESIGDVTDIIFSITSSGQVQYTSPTYSGFISGTIKFRAITTSF
jgi:hypothetical protein